MSDPEKLGGLNYIDIFQSFNVTKAGWIFLLTVGRVGRSQSLVTEGGEYGFCLADIVSSCCQDARKRFPAPPRCVVRQRDRTDAVPAFASMHAGDIRSRSVFAGSHLHQNHIVCSNLNDRAFGVRPGVSSSPRRNDRAPIVRGTEIKRLTTSHHRFWSARKEVPEVHLGKRLGGVAGP